MQSLFTLLRTKYNTLSPTQKQIADFVLANAEQVILLSISDLAAQCSTSETTIVRFLRKLGFDSYQVFRVRMAQEVSEQSAQTIYEEIQQNDSLEQIRDKVIYSTIQSIQDVSHLVTPEQLEQVVELLLNKKNIIFCGLGSSGAVANDALHKFLRLGLCVNCFTDTHLMNIACSQANSETVIFMITHSGESRDILEAIQLARKEKASIVTITSYAHSSATKYADVTLLSSSNETRYRSDAMASRLLQLVLIDILYVAVVMRLGQKGIDNVNRSRLAVASKKV
ncbi:MAG: MurR/RpiR family transcriptional regulator [Anaeromusa sp.]|uniref:MurR/RpiR family transcriptional regulator n=1 Tax=Anaeromusa sp. TaxID=1872520 RepID=UPI002B1EC854|nr:MurR/RpiR family transcriptional regulator [Anaeromusa sp.]MEA4834534.1 MurR/RpiR family transcriptional regulator [Anaeromusa sp.]